MGGTRGSDMLRNGLIVALLGAVVAAGSDLKKTSRIVNGDIIKIEEAPYMVQLRLPKYGNDASCGGAIISPQHILTAAHCVTTEDDFDPVKDMIVAAGASLRTDAGVVRKITKVFIHPDRQNSLYKSDVAVIKLDKPLVEGKSIKIIQLCETSPPVGEHLKVTGWGAKTSARPMHEFTDDDFSKELRSLRLPVISDDDCRKRMTNLPPGFLKSADVKSSSELVYKTNICAFKDKSAFCDSDSGGPAVYQNKVCGVVSWNLGCAYANYPSVFTSVPTVLPFIKDSLKK